MVIAGAFIAVGTLILLGLFAFVGPFHDAGSHDPIVWITIAPWVLLALSCIGVGVWLMRSKSD